MIVLAGTLRILNRDREKVLRTLKTLVTASKAEVNGPTAYHFGVDIEDENLIHVYEEWDQVEHLKAHGQRDHMRVYRSLRTDNKIEVVRFSRWRAEELGEF
jgi:quinol monooxygenase YgiN